MKQMIPILLIAFFCSYSSAQECVCKTCQNPMGQRGPKWTRHWNRIRENANQNAASAPLGMMSGTQVVFLDFDSGKDSSIVYTPQQRDEIQAQMEQIYEQFEVEFTQAPPPGEFSIIVFNSGGTGGVAEDIDFRNLNKSDSALVNADGLGLATEEIVTFSANVASHELGHLLGLRHGDSFGPIGEGVVAPLGSFFSPAYPGPQVASEAFDHAMSTPGIGAPLGRFIEAPIWLSERSSSKIGFAEDGLAVADAEDNDSIENAQQLELQPLAVPNKIVEGINAGAGDLSISAIAVVASLDGNIDGVDTFRIDARAEDIFTIEVISNTVDRLAIDPIDPNISAFGPEGSFLDYYGTDAFNEFEFETPFDCNLIDLVIQNDGPIFLQVDNTMTTDSGLYELWVYRFNGIHGDVNGDGIVDLLDVQPFIDTLLSGQYNPRADINLDGLVNLVDVNPFSNLLSGE